MDALLKTIGLLAGILILAIAYVLSMLHYFAIRKKHAAAKYRTEFVSLLLVLLFSTIVKGIIHSSSTLIVDPFGAGLDTLWSAIYAGIGGLTFEGLLDEPESTDVWLRCMYSGSSIYAGLMIASIVTARASYEIYSGARLACYHLLQALSKTKYVNKCDSYVFTSVTEDALLLAKSISEHYKKDEDEQKVKTKAVAPKGKNKKNAAQEEAERKEGEKQDEDNRNRRCRIIFAGDELEAFDRNNPLHMEIMENSYIYWSYRKSHGNISESVLKRLALLNNNDADDNAPQHENEADGKAPQQRNKKAAKRKREGTDTHGGVHYFALSYNAKLSGLESANSGRVFDEIAAILRDALPCPAKTSESKKQKQCSPNEQSGTTEAPNKKKNRRRNNVAPALELTQKLSVAHFYILSDNDINYSFYKRRLGEIISEAVAPLKKENCKLDFNALCTKLHDYFQLHIINEAMLSADCLAKNRNKLFAERTPSTNLPRLVRENTPLSNNTYRTLVLGFGKNGQYAMQKLYTQTAYVDDEGQPSLFVADVYDSDMDKHAGLYYATHPLFDCCDCETSPIPVALVERKAERPPCTPAEIIAHKNALERAAFNRKLSTIFGITPEELRKGMQFPVIAFHKNSCFSIDFAEFLDSNSGINRGNDSVCFDSIIIALGNDEDNIAMANALLDDIKREIHEKPASDAPATQAKRQTIYINLRDANNYPRINWTNEVYDSRLNVILFGNSVDMYSYDMIVNQQNDMLYHYAYAVVTGEEKLPNDTHAFHEAFDRISAAMNANETANYWQDCQATRDNIFSATTNATQAMNRAWLGVDLFKKQSNADACAFGPYLYDCIEAELCRTPNIMLGSFLKRCSRTEHERWNRFHIANGWTYRDYNAVSPNDSTKSKDERKAIHRANKEHNYLYPFNELPANIKPYDLINSLLAKSGLCVAEHANTALNKEKK